MTRIILLATTLLFSLFTNAQISENRTVGTFSKIKVSNGIDLIYTQASNQEVKVETDDNEKMQYIKTEIEGSTLRVYLDTEKAPKSQKKRKRKNYNSYNGVNFDVLKVYVSNGLVDDFKVSSSASLQIKNELKASDLYVDCSSSGSFTGKIKCDTAWLEASSSADIVATLWATKIDVKTSSSADAKLSGTSDSVFIKTSSSSDCHARDLVCKSAVIESSSSSDVEIHVREKLVASASSSASINYYGNPSNVSAHDSSSGSVSKR